MIPTMLVAGFVLGLLPRRWPHASAVVVGLAVLASLGFGLLVGERRRAPWGAVDDREVLNHARQLTTSD